MSASDKTEKPTPKRRREAREKGQVARSIDVNNAASLLALAAVLTLLAPTLLRQTEGLLREGILRAGKPELASHSGIGDLTTWSLGVFAIVVAPLVAAAAFAGVFANIAQTGLRLTPVALKPSFQKLNVLKGMKRIFGKDGIVEALKACAKTAVVGLVAFFALKSRIPELTALITLTPAALMATLAQLLLDIIIRIGGAFALLAAADYVWQRYRHEKSLKMTHQELKQEVRQADTPPEVKQQVRRRQAEQTRKRMLAEVPTADVVVVNPTHFAVALRYDGSAGAPQVVAKGVDLVAAAIRRVAEESGVTIVHNAPLARSLYREVELGHQIPEDFYAAVAEILAFVYRTARRRPPLKRRSTTPITSGHASR